ncbi:MAG: hypothetical protein HY017_31605 [Betaproteobacteria bacterium]|nr:hypothetical protein [Betaproteobacteria bacterium]
MPVPSLLAPFLEPLERLGLPYCVTGSVAASVYGEPRLTADIDVVLLLGMQDIAALRSAFPDAAYYVPPDETLRLELARNTRGMFNLIHHASQFKADIYLAARDPLHAWALEHRRRISLEESGAWIAPPEYVILRKLEYLREGGQDKHVRDVRFILAASAVDLAFVEAEVARLGLQTQWRQCQAA